MIIALDYDGTFTEDPALWERFIFTAEMRDHRIVAVTMRYQSEGIDPKFLSFIGEENVFFTGRMAKKPFMANLGIHPSIWIDDHPQSVFMDAETIWGAHNVLPEGQLDSRNATEVR
jgi:hypothetical protein